MPRRADLNHASPGVLINIQVLRAFAAMAVVWHHLETRLNSEMGGPHLGFTGMAGVDVFFVISGFIMFHTTQDGAKSAPQFWLDRLIRIAPLYWIATTLVIVLFFLGSQPDGARAISLEDAAAAYAFLPDMRADGYPYPVLDVGWTLVFEAWFYLLFGLTFWMRSQKRALAALVLLFSAGAIVHALVPGLPVELEYWTRPITLEFAAGGFLALALRSPKLAAMSPRLLRWAGWLLLMLGVVGILTVGWRMGWRFNQDFGLRLIGFGAPSVAIVAGALLLERSGMVWRSRTLLLLGASSYAIYIFHQFVVAIAEAIAGKLVAHLDLRADLLIIACAMPAAAVTGIVIHRGLEQPLTRRLKSLTRRRAKPVSSGTAPA